MQCHVKPNSMSNAGRTITMNKQGLVIIIIYFECVCELAMVVSSSSCACFSRSTIASCSCRKPSNSCLKSQTNILNFKHRNVAGRYEIVGTTVQL